VPVARNLWSSFPIMAVTRHLQVRGVGILAWTKDGALMGPIIVAGMALAAVSGAVRVALTWLRRRDRLRHAGERARRERLRQSVRGQVAVFGWRGIAVDIGPGGRW
jgi:hypothetical protein